MTYDASHGSLRSFIKQERPETGCWSKGFWQRERNRPADQCACGVTTNRYVCTALVGTGRSRFEIEDVAECADCGRTRAIRILTARQGNDVIHPWVREREAVYLNELQGAA